jgi:hypothetical protein
MPNPKAAALFIFDNPGTTRKEIWDYLKKNNLTEWDLTTFTIPRLFETTKQGKDFYQKHIKEDGKKPVYYSIK